MFLSAIRHIADKEPSLSQWRLRPNCRRSSIPLRHAARIQGFSRDKARVITALGTAACNALLNPRSVNGTARMTPDVERDVLTLTRAAVKSWSKQMRVKRDVLTPLDPASSYDSSAWIRRKPTC
jgi:hypothetical protein